MIIDREGNIYQGFVGKYGIVVEDTYRGEHFAICLPYENPEDVIRKEEIDNLKDELARTDYKLYKYMDGSLSEEDYAPVKAQRQAWRDRINELEALITNPTITDDEIKAAEDAARKKVTNDHTEVQS